MKPTLNFIKKILLKVSFDKDLFKKELNKSFSLINAREKASLFIWCLSLFGSQYYELIMEAFSRK